MTTTNEIHSYQISFSAWNGSIYAEHADGRAWEIDGSMADGYEGATARRLDGGRVPSERYTNISADAYELAAWMAAVRACG